MATKNYMNEVDGQYLVNRIKALFASKTELQALSDEVDEIIAEGGEPNTIETISKNGTNVPPDAQKNVDISVPTKVSDLTNDGDGTAGSAFATEDYVDTNGGKINKIKKNGTEQTIDPSDKSVNISVPTTVAELSDASNYALTSDVPTAVSDLTNDSGFQTSAEVDAAIAAAVGDITQFDQQVVSELPRTGEKGVIYLVPQSGGSGTNIKDEYIWVNNAWEKIGSTDIDLSGYVQDSDLVAISTATIDGWFAD